MGTPDFAVPTLQALLKSVYSVIGVFTQPDKPKGRGYKLTPSPVKEVALAHNIPVFQPANMRDGEALSILQTLNPDLIVVVAYGKILPMDILELPKYGCINVHGSLLPKYRGAAPIQWSVINGDELAGVTTMYMAKGMDTGDMLLKKSTPILPNETSGELYERLALIGADLLMDTLKNQMHIVPEKQEDSLASHAPMLDKKLAQLDFSNSATAIHHLICGLNPWPIAFTTLDGKILKVYKSNVITEMSGNVGELLAQDKLIIACGCDAIEIIELQLEGGKRMLASDFLRGRKLADNCVFGQ